MIFSYAFCASEAEAFAYFSMDCWLSYPVCILINASSKPCFLNQFTKKYRNRLGDNELVIPAASLYRAKILSTPRTVYGFLQVDSNKYSPFLLLMTSACIANTSVNELGNGTILSFLP